MTSTVVTARDPAAVRNVVERAITIRLGYSRGTVYCVNATSSGVLVHVSSGGNLRAAEADLLIAGYVVEELHGHEAHICDQLGCTLFVTGRTRSSIAAPPAAPRA